MMMKLRSVSHMVSAKITSALHAQTSTYMCTQICEEEELTNLRRREFTKPECSITNKGHIICLAGKGTQIPTRAAKHRRQNSDMIAINTRGTHLTKTNHAKDVEPARTTSSAAAVLTLCK